MRWSAENWGGADEKNPPLFSRPALPPCSSGCKCSAGLRLWFQSIRGTPNTQEGKWDCGAAPGARRGSSRQQQRWFPAGESGASDGDALQLRFRAAFGHARRKSAQPGELGFLVHPSCLAERTDITQPRASPGSLLRVRVSCCRCSINNLQAPAARLWLCQRKAGT